MQGGGGGGGEGRGTGGQGGGGGGKVERNVVGAEIRGIHSIMGGSYSGQYQSVQTPHFTLNYNHCANDDEDKKLFTFQNTQEQVYIAPQVHLSESVAVCFSLWPYVALVLLVKPIVDPAQTKIKCWSAVAQ